MRHGVFCVLLVVASSVQVEAVVPGRDLFLPSVGRGEGSCPGGVCSLWRTDVWVLNQDPSDTATVEISLLRRNEANTDPDTATVAVAPGQTLELADVMTSLFELDGVFGALRFVADREVVVTGRIYDANVQTNLGTGTAGQFFAALPAHVALAAGQSTDLMGLASDPQGDWRTNFGLVETTGNAAAGSIQLLDGEGVVLAETSFAVTPFAARQVSVASLGGPAGGNQRLRVAVGSGQGRVLAFASRVDNRTGDPSTVEMVTPGSNRLVGTYQGVVMTPDGLRLDGGVELVVGSEGLTEFAGTTGIPCGEESFIVDFGTPPIPPVAPNAEGDFVATVTVAYTDGGVPVFAVEWTLTGSLDGNGVMTGTLESVTSNGVGAWAACDGTAARSWRAGWVAPSGGRQ